MWHDAITATEVLANSAVYANVAVATMAVVAGAAVAVVTLVLDYSFENKQVSPIEREHTIASLTHDLRNIES